MLKREKKVFNPLKNKLCDWIDVEKLHNMYERHTRRKHPAPLKKYASMSTRRVSEHHEHPSHRKNNPLSESMREPSNDDHASHSHHTRKAFSASMREPPGSKGAFSSYRRTTYHSEGPNRHTHHLRRKSSDDTATHRTSPPDLRVVLKNWSHKTSNELRPLETLLVEAPTLFPPNNPSVEQHDYFSKWKEFSEDAFKNESGDDLKELLKRAVRKAKVRLYMLLLGYYVCCHNTDYA